MKNKTDWGEVLVSGFSYSGGLENALDKNTSYISPPVKGDGLIHRASGQHTIQIHTINFSGNISIDATMDRDPASGAWLPVQLTDTQSGNVVTSLNFLYPIPVPGVPNSGKTVQINKFYMAVGQYSWLKANISNVTNGTVDSIKIAF
jgi:hypothetical protein